LPKKVGEKHLLQVGKSTGKEAADKSACDRKSCEKKEHGAQKGCRERIKECIVQKTGFMYLTQ